MEAKLLLAYNTSLDRHNNDRDLSRKRIDKARPDLFKWFNSNLAKQFSNTEYGDEALYMRLLSWPAGYPVPHTDKRP